MVDASAMERVALAGRTVVVTGADGPVGAGVAEALARRGAAVAPVGAGGGAAGGADCGFGSRQEVEEAFGRARGRLRGMDGVVHAALPAAALRAEEVAVLSEERWAAIWEASMRSALWALQAAWTNLQGHGGSVVMVLPALSMSGAAGFAPLATAAEGQRLLATSAARQWAGAGIRVNCAAVGLAAYGVRPAGAGGAAPRGAPSPGPGGLALAGLGGLALSGPGDDPLDDVGPVVAFLVSDGSRSISGATVPVGAPLGDL